MKRELLAELAPEIDRERGVGRAVQRIIEAHHGNFEHIREEYLRLTQYHNEHADETSFLKTELLDHEDPQFTGTNAPGRGYGQLATVASGSWNQDDDFALDDFGQFVPVFLDTPTRVTNLGLIITARWRPLVGGFETHRRAHMAIYHSDAEGFFPKTLAADMGYIDWSAAPDQGPSPDYEVGPPVVYWSDGDAVELAPGWYWMGGALTMQGPTGTTLVSTDNNGYPLGANINVTGWDLGGLFMAPYWPFPRLTNGENWGGMGNASDTPMCLSHLWEPGDLALHPTGDSAPPDRFGDPEGQSGMTEEDIENPWNLNSNYFYDVLGPQPVYKAA